MAILEDTLAMKTAKLYVRTYTDEQNKLMQEHYEAMDCLDCEAFLQLGIDAYDWISRASRHATKQFRAGTMQPTAELRDAFDALYRSWLRSVEFARRWIAVQQARGFQLDNQGEFEQAVYAVEKIVADSDRMAELGERAKLVSVETIATCPPPEWAAEG